MVDTIVSQPRSAGLETAWSPPERGGWTPLAAVLSASGMLVVTVAFLLSRANEALPAAQLLYWVGLGLVYTPLFVRLLGRDASRGERIALVAIAGAVLYALKILHDPVVFTYRRVRPSGQRPEHRRDGAPVREQPVLPPSTPYPGVAICAAAISQVTGLGLFSSALAVIGIARVLLVVAVLLVVERVTGSARLGGLAAIIYCANSNYLFYSAQFSYESLALPLAMVVLVCAVRTERLHPRSALGYTALGVLILVAVAATHHLTSYATAGFLWLMVIVPLLFRRSLPVPRSCSPSRRPSPQSPGSSTSGANTEGYLGSIFTRAFDSLRDTLLSEQSARVPFGTGAAVSGTTEQTPLLDKALAVGSVLITIVFVPWGAWILRRRYWDNALAMILTAAALVFLGAYAPASFRGRETATALGVPVLRRRAGARGGRHVAGRRGAGAPRSSLGRHLIRRLRAVRGRKRARLAVLGTPAAAARGQGGGDRHQAPRAGRQVSGRAITSTR